MSFQTFSAVVDESAKLFSPRWIFNQFGSNHSFVCEKNSRTIQYKYGGRVRKIFRIYHTKTPFKNSSSENLKRKQNFSYVIRPCMNYLLQLIHIIKGLYLYNEFPDTYAHHVSSLIKLRQSIYIKLILHTRTVPVRRVDPSRTSVNVHVINFEGRTVKTKILT